MGFSSSAQSSLNANRKLRSSNKRGFKTSRDKFSVKALPKLEFTEESRKRVKAEIRRKDTIGLTVMIIVIVLIGVILYSWS